MSAFLQERDGLSVYILDFRDESLTGRCDLERSEEPFISIASTFLETLASSILMIWCICTLIRRSMPSANGCWSRYSSKCLFYIITGVHRCQESEETKPGPKKCNFHVNKASTQFVRKIFLSFFSILENRCLFLRLYQHGYLYSQKNLCMYKPSLIDWTEVKPKNSYSIATRLANYCTIMLAHVCLHDSDC